MSYLTAEQLTLTVKAFWLDQSETYLLGVEVWCPLHRAMKFERWAKTRCLGYRISASSSMGYRIYVLEAQQSCLLSALERFRQLGAEIHSECQCSDEEAAERLARKAIDVVAVPV